jgi:hypothetical protein
MEQMESSLLCFGLLERYQQKDFVHVSPSTTSKNRWSNVYFLFFLDWQLDPGTILLYQEDGLKSLSEKQTEKNFPKFF